MATASVKDDPLLKCPVCFDEYKTPRKLPICSHSFCEGCILTFLTKVNPDLQQKGTFPCPICRVMIPCPRENRQIAQWARMLELDECLTEKVLKCATEKSESSTQDGKTEFCVSCKEREKFTPAVKFCLDCQESLCKTCCDIAHRFRVLQRHTILDDTHVKNSKEKGALKHLLKYLMCEKHADQALPHVSKNTFDCVKCLSECEKKDFTDLKDIPSNNENEKRSKNLLDKFSKLKTLGKAIIDVKKSNESENKKKVEDIRSKIQEMRTHASALFDSLEDSAVQKCKALTKTFSICNEEIIQDLEGNINNLNDYQSLLEMFADKVPESMLCVLISNIEKRFAEDETCILEQKETCKCHGFELETLPNLKALIGVDINDTHKLAEIEQTMTDIQFPEYTERYLLRYCSVADVKHYSPELEDVEQLQLYTGIACLPGDENLALVIDNKIGYCCLTNTDFEIVDSFDTDYEVYDEAEYLTCDALEEKGYGEFNIMHPVGISAINNDSVVISVPALHKLVFLSVDRDKQSFVIMGEVWTEKKPFAVCGLSNGDVVVTWTEPWSVSVLVFKKHCQYDEIMYLDRDSDGRVFKTFRFIAVDERNSHIIQPCIHDRSVYCFDFQGKPKFQYQHEELSLPQGVALDSDCNIYICDSENRAIHVVTSSGIGVRLIKDCNLHWPVAITFKPEVKSLSLHSHTTTPLDTFGSINRLQLLV